MKKYILILAFIALASAEEWKLQTRKEWQAIEDSCIERNKALLKKLESYKTEKYPPKEEFRLHLCVFRDAGVWSDTEGFSIDRLMIVVEKVSTKENLNKTALRDSLETCADKNSEGSPTLDWAYRSYKCFKDNELLYNTLEKARYQEPQEE